MCGAQGLYKGVGFCLQGVELSCGRVLQCGLEHFPVYPTRYSK